MTGGEVGAPRITIERRTTAECAPEVLTELRALLDVCFPDFDDHHWAHTHGGVHVLASDGDDLVGHAAVVPRRLLLGDEPVGSGYVEAVAVDPARRGLGLGRLLMDEIAGLIRLRHEFGVLCTGSHEFYERLGWERWAGPTYVRHGDLVVRTPESDGTVMVLRHGPTAMVDLGAPITCDTRPGDDW